MTLTQEAFLAFTGSVLVGFAVVAFVWRFGPRPRFRVVDRLTGEVVAYFFSRRAAHRRSIALNWHGSFARGSRPRFRVERRRTVR